ncbi:MAG: hypothetical protein ACOYYI_01350 [Chloroflexota bacterium]
MNFKQPGLYLVVLFTNGPGLHSRGAIFMDFAKIFEGRALVKPVEVGAAVGWSDQHCRNLLSRGRFPFPVIEVGGVKFCRVRDLDSFLERKAVEAGIVSDVFGSSLGRGKRGRMTKLERAVEEKLARMRSSEGGVK